MRGGNSFRSAAAFSVASKMDLYCLTCDTIPEILEDKSEEEQRDILARTMKEKVVWFLGR
jgi:hypothetical protein